ncbi:MAG: histidine kinase [Bacteroidetes bacterium]|nr:histidine kinase [Bacteroidota bacterium]
MTLSENITNRLLRLASKRPVRHSLFWAGLFVLYSLVEMFFTQQGFFYTLSNNVVRLILLGMAVYYNIYVLIPRYLAGKKFMPYIGFLLLTVFIVTPLEAFLIYAKSGSQPDMQATVLGSLNWSFLPNFFILGTSTVVKITLDWYTNIRERQELVTQTMQSELRFLKSQINPHFLFNTLNSLYALTLKKSELAPDIVLKLSEMMRYMLYECNEKWVPLSKEVNYIANYLELERLRQGGRVDICFEVQGSVSDQKIAPLMFIPFIENCFKHGLGSQLTRGFVNIRLEVRGNELDLQIENSKAESMPKPLHHRSGGIGLVNVRRRLDLLYPNRYQLNIEDSPNSYRVNLKLLLE